MYVLLVATLLAGLTTTVLGNATGHPHDYRLTVALHFRSIFYFHPDVNLITRAPLSLPRHHQGKRPSPAARLGTHRHEDQQQRLTGGPR